MKSPRIRRSAWTLVFAVLVLAAGAIVGITSAFSDSATDHGGRCIKPQKPTVVGEGPVQAGGGKRWTVAASLRSAKECEGLLFTMRFRPDGTRRGSWRETRFEPPIGQPPLSPPGSPEVSAQDEVAPLGRVLSGFVSTNVSSVRVNFDNRGAVEGAP